jgi:chromosome segregation ATPase
MNLDVAAMKAALQKEINTLTGVSELEAELKETREAQQRRFQAVEKKLGECATELAAIKDGIPKHEAVHLTLTGVVETSQGAIARLGNGSTDLENAANDVAGAHKKMEEKTTITDALQNEIEQQENSVNGLVKELEVDAAALGTANALTDETNAGLNAGITSMQDWIRMAG